MNRRTFIGATAVALSGCSANIGREGTETSTPEDYPQRDAEYLGLHDDHEIDIEDVTYTIYGPCRATVSVRLHEQPPDDTVIMVYLYRNGEKVTEGGKGVNDIDYEDKMRETVDIQYCTMDDYDAFRVAMYRME